MTLFWKFKLLYGPENPYLENLSNNNVKHYPGDSKRIDYFRSLDNWNKIFWR